MAFLMYLNVLVSEIFVPALDTDSINHDGDFRNIEWKYPRTDECNGILHTLSERYKSDVFFDKKGKNVKNGKGDG